MTHLHNLPPQGSPNDDNIVGTHHGEVIHGDAGNDSIDGVSGADQLYGDTGNDQIVGGKDGSGLFGGDGEDTVFGGNGDDTIKGGVGDDLLDGARGTDWEYGGAGNDTIRAGDPFSTEINHSYGGTGDDFVAVWSRAGGDADGGAGTDTIQVNWAGLTGPGGPMRITLSGPDAGAFAPTLSLALTGFERLIALTDQGDDTVKGGALNDEIYVGTGNNLVYGYSGNDYLKYMAGGANMIYGGDGIDTLRVWSNYGPTVLTVTGTSATDNYGSVITDVEKWEVMGSNHADSATLGALSDKFLGYDGDDTVFGNGGDDRLSGGSGNDQIFGGSGKDFLSGDKGFDLLTGGTGADVFRFVEARDFGDEITDMESGVDTVAISALAIGHALGVGRVTDAAFALDVASGSGAQFVLQAGSSGGMDLVFDANGSAAGGESWIATLDGTAGLVASDILIY